MSADALAVLDAITPEQVPAAILRLSARLIATPREDAATPDEQLSVDEAARLLRVTRRFVWNHARELGATRVSARKIVLSRRRLVRWLEARR